ncbi:TPM domain-containing protein [Leucobacter sp. CSA1]|uniref:TPM domain-containing protein n=1 Tax=Leucobacter chromiisoli TaxID=2796471 RepID=A0A934Q731_9MICO|nr:TPM domain-containing protein [Leucobacter chromiisoli]MBK0418946.1 TPM domain-containing protein [Leucobacter chromiisoli]
MKSARIRAPRWIVAGAAAAGAAWVLLAGAPAGAVEPVALGDSYVADEADVLGAADERAANARLAATFAETGIDLYVVLVDEFTNPGDRVSWANETAELNGLGDSQYLLAVSTEGRQYFISALDGGPLSDRQLDAIEERILPELRDGDWSGAISAAAEQVETEHGAAGRTTAIVVGSVAGAVGVGGAAFGISRAVRGRRASRERREELEELEQRSGSALVAADDAVTTSEQELQFAGAQFGEAAVAEFAEALEAARTQLIEAFGLRQQLDDAVPDTEEQRRQWLTRILELCAAVDATLDAQSEPFERLRDIERNAPAALEALEQRRAAAAGGAETALAELSRLSADYAAEELSSVSANPGQADGLLSFAQVRAAAARTSLEGGRTGEAAVAIREAEAAVGQAEGLGRAIGKHGEQLARVEERCTELISEIQGDVAAASAVPDPDGRIAAAVRETEERIERARADLSGADRRPSRAVEALEAANANIDGVVQAARDAERARQLLNATLAQAGDRVLQAEGYIASRRGAVGSTARTRAAEARASLSRAESARAGDPQSALREAQRADRLAAEALSAAQLDVEGFGGADGYGGYRGSSGGSPDLAAVLGGILGDSGGGFGGSRGGSWGGSWGGGSRRGGGSSRSSRSRSSGSRRSSSSRSSGSRRSRGGGRF